MAKCKALMGSAVKGLTASKIQVKVSKQNCVWKSVEKWYPSFNFSDKCNDWHTQQFFIWSHYCVLQKLC